MREKNYIISAPSLAIALASLERVVYAEKGKRTCLPAKVGLYPTGQNKLKNLFLLVSMIFILQSTMVKAQFDLDYNPYVPQGEIPQECLALIKGEHSFSFQNTRRLSKEHSTKFRKATLFALQETFADGDIYFNDPMTKYVRSIGNQLLKGKPYSNRISFYVKKDVSVNATAWQDGSIIVNIGLLAQLHNQDQLAFVLAHEISHFLFQHPYLQFADHVIHNEKNKDSSVLTEGFNDQIKHAIHHEVMADSMALQFIGEAGFSVEEGGRVIELLLNNEDKEFPNLAAFFTTDSFPIDSEEMCQAKEFHFYKQSPIYSSDKHFSQKSLETRLNRVASQINDRKEELVEVTYKNESLEDFAHISTMAKFELVEQASRKSNYLRSTYEALLLNRKYPNNKYLHIKVAENLYYINRYNNLDVLEKLFIDNQQIERDNYAALCCFINKLKGESLNKMTYAFIMKQYSRFGEHERMIYIASASKATLEKQDEATLMYKKYIKLYPNGIFSLHVKQKLR